MEHAKFYMKNMEDFVDEVFKDTPAWKVVTYSAVGTCVLLYVKDILWHEKSAYERIKDTVFRLLRKVPIVRKQIDSEISKISGKMKEDFDSSINNDDYMIKLPEKGLSEEEVVRQAKIYSSYGKFQWEDGCASGAVYSGDKDLTRLVTEVYALTVWTNPLHADVFPGIRKMEAEVIRMCCNMFHGGPDSCGTMTTGGTESILMACKAYRDYAINVKGISRPEMVVPVTAHAAFDKASQILNVPIKHAPIDPITMKVNVKAMKKLISRRTCMIVGSAPQFPHGIIDPIEELSHIAQSWNIPLHVDACLGGFLIAFMEDGGYKLPPFDFRVPGVTSISCDTHKYGFSPKGSSVILYSNTEYRHHQFFVAPDWPGGIYATPSMAGSRPGAIIAATWASLVYHGRNGYSEITRQIIQTTKEIERRIRNIHGLEIMGKPEVSVVAFTSKHFNILSLSDKMTEKGWNLNALQFPSCIHIAVTVLHTKEGVVDKLIDDLWQITNEFLEKPPEKLHGNAAIYGLAQSIPDRSIVNEVAWSYLDCCYDTSKDKIKTNGNAL